MHRFVVGTFLAFTFSLSLSAADWPQFRGPNGDGHADGAKLPTEWDRAKNVTWRKEIPGLGWSSPVVVDGRIFLTTAVPTNGDYSLRALALHAKTGDVIWNVEVFHEDGKTFPGIHRKNSHASPTAVVEGDAVFVHFGHMGTACLNAKDGSKVWTQQSLGYKPVHGNGGSPVLAGDHLIFSIDGTDRQEVVALDKRSGKIAWRTPRDLKVAKPFSFSTPLLITVNGQDQLVSAGSGAVMSLDPKTGKELWRVKYGTGYSVVPKPVFGNGLIYLSSGYDSPVFYAIKPDGRGDVTDTHIAWKAQTGAPRNASPLVVDDAVYLAADDGRFTCLDAKTGKVRWRESTGRAYSASPLFANGLIYLLDEDGLATIVKPGVSYEEVIRIKMGEKALASYGVDGDALLVRTEKALYRIEKQ
jgi:outer membrane protein assembly factor BamB